jgi:hypothetical protein
MGLDMYLYAGKFISNTPPFKEGTRHEEIVDALDAQGFAKGHIVTQMEVAYWRKANAIHGWFVDGEDDDCTPIPVSRENLVRLRDVCKELLVDKDANKAEELLPPMDGFFFGSTGIDEWYWENVQETATLLDNILTQVPEDWSFEYQASW